MYEHELVPALCQCEAVRQVLPAGIEMRIWSGAVKSDVAVAGSGSWKTWREVVFVRCILVKFWRWISVKSVPCDCSSARTIENYKTA